MAVGNIDAFDNGASGSLSRERQEHANAFCSFCVSESAGREPVTRLLISTRNAAKLVTALSLKAQSIGNDVTMMPTLKTYLRQQTLPRPVAQ